MYFVDLQKYKLWAAHYYFNTKNVLIKVRSSQENYKIIFTNYFKDEISVEFVSVKKFNFYQ